VSPLELVLFGALCYLFGLVSGAVLIPWLVDRGLSNTIRYWFGGDGLEIPDGVPGGWDGLRRATESTRKHVDSPVVYRHHHADGATQSA